MSHFRLRLESLPDWLHRPVEGSTLGLFRILFGTVMVWEICRYFYFDKITRYYIDRDFHFTYPFFDFIQPLPGNGSYLHFLVVGVAALFLALGLFYRLAAVVFFLGYCWIFLIDETEYNNHYYLICLLGFLFSVVDAHRWMAWDAWRRPGPATVPFWQLLLFRFQIIAVYFYGGVAKINGDWLAGEPLRHWLAWRADDSLLGQFLETEGAVYFFSYGGLLFDLAIGFLLIFRKTRPLAIGMVVFFHVVNEFLFTIGIFPYMMLASTVLFLEPGTPGKWMRKLNRWYREPPTLPAPPGNSRRAPWVTAGITLYLLWQLMFPLRHWLYPGNVAWTEEGHMFAWRMKLRSKTGFISFQVADPEKNKRWRVDLLNDLDRRQIRKMRGRPHMIIQYAHHLGDRMRSRGVIDPVVRVRTDISLNFRPPQRLIDPQTNLMEETHSAFSHSRWILPLKSKP